MARTISIGTVFSKAGSTNLPSGTYVYGDTFYADRGNSLSLKPEITAGSTGVGITAAKFKLQTRSTTADTWDDLQTIDTQLGNQLIEQAVPDGATSPTYAVPGSGVTSGYGPLVGDPSANLNGFRIGVKVTGTAHADTSISVSAAISITS